MKKEIIKTNIKAVTSGSKHHFFGYYDKCPWDSSGRFILSMEVDFIDHLPGSADIAEIGVVDLTNNNQFKPISKTWAWNWQQGCMLQWFPSHDKCIIFNDKQDNKFVSVIVNIETNKKKILPFPIYSIHPSGKWAVTLNFSRLDHVREGYGYKGVVDKHYNEVASDKDGIFLLNLETGKYNLIISLADLYNYKHIDLMDQGKHWVNHLTFNPSGNRFVFLHRWQLRGGRMYTRLFTANKDGSDLYLLLDSGMASHFGWKNDKQILAWGRIPTALAGISKKRWLMKFLLPIYRKLKIAKGLFRRKFIGDNFLLFTDKSKNFEKIGDKILDDDGHCSFSPDEKWILTDTYPDKDYYRTLILYNLEKNKRIDIGKFYSISDKKYGTGKGWEISGMRCDLHPRWNTDGTEICIDSVHEGSRQVYILDVSSIIKSFR